MEQADHVGKIHSVRCNCDGTKVSFLAEALESDGAEEKLFVYDDYLDKFLCYEFENRKPVSHCWDDEDCRLLACQTMCSEVRRSVFDGDCTWIDSLFAVNECVFARIVSYLGFVGNG